MGPRLAAALAAAAPALAGLHTHLHLDRVAYPARIDRLVLQPLLDRDACGQGLALAGKDHEQAVTQQLDHPATVLFEGLAERTGQLGHEAAGGLVAEPLKDAGASDQVRKNNGGHDQSAPRGD